MATVLYVAGFVGAAALNLWLTWMEIPGELLFVTWVGCFGFIAGVGIYRNRVRLRVLWEALRGRGHATTFRSLALGADEPMLNAPARPAANVTLVRFVKGRGLTDSGFALVNDSDTTAFDVTIEPFSFGRYTVTVGSGVPLPRLAKTQDEQVIGPIWLEGPPGHHTTDLYGALLEWERTQSKEHEGVAVPCVVTWREQHVEPRYWRRYLLTRDTISTIAIRPDSEGTGLP